MPLFGLIPTNPMSYSNNTRDLEQRAIFGEVSYDLTDKLTATVGGRYFEYEKNERRLREGGFAGNVPIGTGVPADLESDESDSSLKASLSYEPTEDSLVYASWSEGFRLGRPDIGVPSALCDTDNDGLVDNTDISVESTRSIGSDFLENYEIGGKVALLNRRMVLDAAVFHIDWTGLPISAIATCGNLPFGYNINAGAATSEGVELQATLLVVDGLRIDLGGGYTDAKLSKGSPGIGAEGDRLPGSPKVTANFAAQYDFLIARHNAFVRLDSLYAGSFYGDLLQSPSTLAGDYIKVDARAGISVNGISVELFVRNLTNEDAYTWRGTTASPALGYRLRPRTIGVQFGYDFSL